MKIVLDTNILVSAAVRRDGPSAIVLRWVRDGFIDLIMTEALAAEFERVIHYPRIGRKVSGASDWQDPYVREIRMLASVVVPGSTAAGAVPRDPNDEMVLDAAIAGEVDYIVTGDQDLLTLGDYRGIEIVTPVRFLQIVQDRGADRSQS